MKLKKNVGHYTYSFKVTQKDGFLPLEVAINRNDKPYCIFSKACFLYPDSDKKANMSIEEISTLWKHINFYGNAVDDHPLKLSF